jgi:hypothetical protein
MNLPGMVVLTIAGFMAVDFMHCLAVIEEVNGSGQYPFSVLISIGDIKL